MAQAQMGMSGGPGQGGGVPGQGAPARDAGSGADIEGLSEELADNDPRVRLQAVRELAAAAKDEDAINHEYSDTWILPPLALLRPGEKQATADSDNDKRARVIESTLSSHGVDVTVTEINEGPAVTQFGITPGWDIKTKAVSTKGDDGEIHTHHEEISRSRVRVKAVTSLQNDLALALATQEIRIEAPVPGKPIIGLEVPNSQTQLVMLRDILESKVWQISKSDTALGIPLGSDISGQAVVADLAKMPHLLIAGATGSGKSVWPTDATYP